MKKSIIVVAIVVILLFIVVASQDILNPNEPANSPWPPSFDPNCEIKDCGKFGECQELGTQTECRNCCRDVSHCQEENIKCEYSKNLVWCRETHCGDGASSCRDCPKGEKRTACFNCEDDMYENLNFQIKANRNAELNCYTGCASTTSSSDLSGQVNSR